MTIAKKTTPTVTDIAKSNEKKASEQAYKETVQICIDAIEAMPASARESLLKAFADSVMQGYESTVTVGDSTAKYAVGIKAFGDAVKHLYNGWDLWNGTKTAPKAESEKTDAEKTASLEPKFKKRKPAPAPVTESAIAPVQTREAIPAPADDVTALLHAIMANMVTKDSIGAIVDERINNALK